MSEVTDPGDAPLSVPSLRTAVVGSRVLVFDEIDSTNVCAARVAGDGTVVVAESQTAGRGRHGRTWHSARGLGLWFSVALDGAMRGLSLAAAVAVREALTPWCEAALKWPNDVLLNGRKVCGILVEQRGGRTVVGLGINVRHRPTDFPPELRATASSVEWETGLHCDRGLLLQRVLVSLDEAVLQLRRGRYDLVRAAWLDACHIQGRRIRVEEVEGTVVDVDGHGALVLLTPQGERRVLSGEIELVEGV